MTSNLDLIRGRQVVQPLTNQSGGAIIAGDVVIVSAANDESFTTTTSAAYNSTRVGVALDSIAAAASGRILLEGYAPLVNVSASATRGHYLLTHTVAKQATSQASYAAGAFGQIIKAGTTPSAVIFPVAQVGSAGVARSGSTTDEHLAVWNGSNVDSIKDGGAVPASANGLLAVKVYAPATTAYSTTSVTLADVDATNLVITFTAPASGNVLVRLSAWADTTQGAGGSNLVFGLREATTNLAIGGIVLRTTASEGYVSTPIYLAGISAGSHTYKWSFALSVAQGTGRIVIGPGSTGTGQFGPAIMEVWAAP